MKANPTGFSLLLVDDEPIVLSFLQRIFSDDGYHIQTALTGEDAVSLITKTRFDAALIDFKMPGMDGLTLLKEVRKLHPGISVIMLTGHGGVKEAVRAMKLGAVDFLEKPFSAEALRARVAQLYQIWELNEENRKLQAKMNFQFGFDHLVGNSTGILKLKQMITQVGPTDATILIQGETGTGKQLVARAIHHHSPRRDSRFVPVDCAAISETVMESELFGHVKGAFTGAHTSTLGLIRSADEGTLFLDEVSEISQAVQVKLLRTIQEKEVRPVGSSRSHQVDVRIFAATNRDLAEEVDRGRFREDLFYRLNVLTINVPPLRDRKEDIALLVTYFLKRFATDYSPVRDASPEALFCLEEYDWPGNIRELENVMRRAVALGKEDTILPEDLPPKLQISSPEASQSFVQPSDGTLAAYEKVAIQNALTKAGSNRKRAAQMLGIGEATLYRKLRKYQIRS
ncbi:MAG: response regulator [Proteobacteria bacterium]|nr:response regulator [Pseudomonadota bacterium]